MITPEKALQQENSEKQNKNIDFITVYSEPIGEPITKGTQNILLSERFGIATNNNKVNQYIDEHSKNRTRINNNVILFGQSASGKTRCIEANIHQANGSMLIVDTNNNLYNKYAKYLEEKNYTVKKLDFEDVKNSDFYNPFKYIKNDITDDRSIERLVEAIMKATTPADKFATNPFWEASERTLLNSLIAYLYHYTPEEEQKLCNIINLLNLAGKTDEANSNMSELDNIFKKVEEKDPDGFAIKQYKTFNAGAGRTLKSIIISCMARMQIISHPKIQKITDKDNLEIEKAAKKDTAIFLEQSTVNTAYNFIYSIFIYQFIKTMYYCKDITRKDDQHITLYIDELANLNIYNLDFYIPTSRNYNISFFLTIQALSQLKALYPTKYAAIIGSCDIKLFYGSGEKETLEYFAKEIVNRKSVPDYKRNASITKETDRLYKLKEDECIIIASHYIIKDKKI